MKKLQNITDEPHQRHTIVFEESEIVLSLRYLPTVEMWIMDVGYGDVSTHGLKLSVGVLHMRSRNLPFDFIVTDNIETGLDPIRADDFSTGRCAMYLLEADDMQEIRGAAVPF